MNTKAFYIHIGMLVQWTLYQRTFVPKGHILLLSFFIFVKLFLFSTRLAIRQQFFIFFVCLFSFLFFFFVWCFEEWNCMVVKGHTSDQGKYFESIF